MVWVQDEHVMVVINNALPRLGKVANDVNEGAESAWRIEPGLSKSYGLK